MKSKLSFLVGYICGVTTPFVLAYHMAVKFAKENPDHPQAVDFIEKRDKTKESFKKAVEETKASWRRSKEQVQIDREFKRIVND